MKVKVATQDQVVERVILVGIPVNGHRLATLRATMHNDRDWISSQVGPDRFGEPWIVDPETLPCCHPQEARAQQAQQSARR